MLWTDLWLIDIEQELHNDLSGLQGGSPDEYYHLDLTDYNKIPGYDAHLALINEHIDWTNATNNFLTTGTITGKQFIGWGITPIGTIIGWAKSFTGTPSLPDGWVECNGQMISDSDSVYNGQSIPDLNGNAGSENKRFLRGSSTSGSTGGSNDHRHNQLVYNVGFSLGLVYYYVLRSIYTYYATATPRYYEVVYIMRIK